MDNLFSYCTFAIGPQWFGLDIQRVREVLPRPSITRVPLAPRPYRGVVPLRGQLVTALDLGERLDLPRSTALGEGYGIVVEPGAEPLVLLVDRIGDVETIAMGAIEPPPRKVPWNDGLLRGICERGDGLLLMLDLERVAKAATDLRRESE